jgi:hypothetical protein
VPHRRRAGHLDSGACCRCRRHVRLSSALQSHTRVPASPPAQHSTAQLSVQDVILRGGNSLPLFKRVVEAGGPPAVVLPASGGELQVCILPLKEGEGSWSCSALHHRIKRCPLSRRWSCAQGTAAGASFWPGQQHRPLSRHMLPAAVMLLSSSSRLVQQVCMWVFVGVGF